MVRERFGAVEALPTMRFLFVDTDPETTAEATRGPEPFATRQVVLARLNRPAHYLQRDGLPSVEQWLLPGLLYRLPKNPGPAAGVRAFGRLALFDNYRLIAQRVRQEIETFLTDVPLAEADKHTRLGLRSNRPRAYVVAGLAGGWWFFSRWAARPAIDGDWVAELHYAWEPVPRTERFQFSGRGRQLAGTASFLGVPRGLVDGEVDREAIRFASRSAEMGGGELVHRYQGWLGDDGVLHLVMQTEGGSGANAPVEFVARRAGAGSSP